MQWTSIATKKKSQAFILIVPITYIQNSKRWDVSGEWTICEVTHRVDLRRDMIWDTPTEVVGPAHGVFQDQFYVMSI